MEKEIVIFEPLDQLAHLSLVVNLIIVSDEAHHSRVICKFDNMFGVVAGHSHASAASWEHTPVAHLRTAGGVAASLYILWPV